MSFGFGCTLVDAPREISECDDSIPAISAVPPEGLRGPAVGSGDTWFAAPATGTWSQDVRWNGESYFLKLGIWTLMDKPPSVQVHRLDRAAPNGSASFRPTSAGLPGPLPTEIRFPTTGCWEITASGASGSARAVIRFDESAKHP